MSQIPTITTERLSLVSMSAAFLQACLANDRAEAARLIGLDLPDEWFNERWLIDLRLNDMRRNPASQPWLLWAIALTSSNEMIGHVGFHTPPDPEYLRETAPGGIEMGYTIFPQHRQHGYASEAVAGMIDWARREHGISRFVVSISPENEPSMRIARRFGFVKVASHMDEEDGPEDVMVLDVE